MIMEWSKLNTSEGSVSYCQLMLTFLSHSIFLLQVLNLSKFLLLQTASPEAVVRLECTPLAAEKECLNQVYSQQQYHKSIIEFLGQNIQLSSGEEGLLLQVYDYLLVKQLLNSV